MKSNYKYLGKYITEIDDRNVEDSKEDLLGVSVQKKFIKSKSNTIGTDFTNYKKVRKGQFVYVPDTGRRGEKIGIAMLDSCEQAMVSQVYIVFTIKDSSLLLPEYLMMWFRRPEFDRYARFKSNGSVREIFDWQDMCEVLLPIPHPDKQKVIVKEYNTIVNRIALNNHLIKKLEETAQAIYKQWFVDFEFPNEEGKPYKSSGGEMEINEELEREIPKNWICKSITDICKIKYGKNLPTEELLDYGYFVFGGNGVIGRYSNYIYEQPQVLIACRGAASGKIRISFPKSYVTNNSIVFEQTDENDFNYLKQYCLNNSFEEFVTGSAQPQVTIDSLNSIKLMWPTIEILKAHSLIISKFDKNLLIKQMELEELHKLNSILLSKLATIEN